MLDVLRRAGHAPAPHGPGGDTPMWTEASAERPCPVCGAPGGCAVIEGGEFARCMHAPSRWPVLGGGWLHRLAGRPDDPADDPGRRAGGTAAGTPRAVAHAPDPRDAPGRPAPHDEGDDTR